MEAGMNQVEGPGTTRRLAVELGQLPLPREEFGFRRTACACTSCQVHCRIMPGSLVPSDLARLCPPGQELFAWAEVHLRAVAGTPFPTLVPARATNGHCHWLFAGRCAVHEAAPFGCAFFDTHMTDGEMKQRLEATLQARRLDAAAQGPYYQVWRHLRLKGLTAEAGNRSVVLEQVAKIRSSADRVYRTLPRPKCDR